MLYLKLVSDRVLNYLSITASMVFMITEQQNSKAINPQLLYAETFTQHHKIDHSYLK